MTNRSVNIFLLLFVLVNLKPLIMPSSPAHAELLSQRRRGQVLLSDPSSSGGAQATTIPDPPKTEPSSQATMPGAPATPPPSRNKTKPGGGLSSSLACSARDESLTALVPVENPVVTTKANPTVLFYIPYASADVRLGEFSLLTRDEQYYIYETEFTLPQTPGIVSINIPSSAERPLEVGKYYHWYLKIYCKENNSRKSDLSVNGWIQRVTLTEERSQQIESGSPDVWYDSLARVAEQLRADPENKQQYQPAWSSLLRSINAKHLEKGPILGPVILKE